MISPKTFSAKTESVLAAAVYCTNNLVEHYLLWELGISFEILYFSICFSVEGIFRITFDFKTWLTKTTFKIVIPINQSINKKLWYLKDKEPSRRNGQNLANHVQEPSYYESQEQYDNQDQYENQVQYENQEQHENQVQYETERQTNLKMSGKRLFTD